MDYFEEVSSALKIEELNVLGYLIDEEATASFKAVARKEVREVVSVTDAIFKKTIYLLETKKLIQVVRNQAKHDIFITQYGMEAVNYSLQGAE